MSHSQTNRYWSDEKISRELIKFLRHESSNEFTTLERFSQVLCAAGVLVEDDRIASILQTQKRRDGTLRFECNMHHCYRATQSSSSATPAGFALHVEPYQRRRRTRSRNERIARKIVWYLRRRTSATLGNDSFVAMNDVICNVRAFGSIDAIMDAIDMATPHRDRRPRFELKTCEDGSRWIRATPSTREFVGGSPMAPRTAIAIDGEDKSEGNVVAIPVVGPRLPEMIPCVGSHVVVQEGFERIANGYLTGSIGQVLCVKYVGVAGEERGWGFGFVVDESEEMRGWFPLKNVHKLADAYWEEVEAVAAASINEDDSMNDDVVGEELLAKFKKLDDRVASRKPRIVQCTREDRQLVQSVGRLVEQWVLLGLWKGSFSHWPFLGGGKVDSVPNIMDRITLFCGVGIEARMHIFKDASETRIHNHRTPFYSYCLFGDYEHCLWKANPSSSETHYEFNRTMELSLQQIPTKLEGRLEVELAHQHQKGLTYFLNAHGVHTVKHEGPEPVVTLYIKGMDSIVDSFVFHEEEAPAWGNKNEAEVTLDEEDRRRVFEDLSRLLTSDG